MIRRSPAVALLLLAVASGVAWRLELELRGGWDGLAWIGYVHWTLPIAVVAFIAWAAIVAPVRKRALFVIALVCIAAASYAGVEMVQRGLWLHSAPIFLAYAAGLYLPRVIPVDGALGLWSLPILWAMIPLAFSLACRLFGAPIDPNRAVLAALLFVLSRPISILLLALLRHPGAADEIHAVKSGIIIPFLIFSLGLPLLRSRRSEA